MPVAVWYSAWSDCRAALQPVLALRGKRRDERQRPICVLVFRSRDEFQLYAPMGRSIGFFLPGDRRDFIVLDGSFAESRAAGHEYVHYVTAQSGFRLPVWLNEGLAELYSNLGGGRSEPRTSIGGFIPYRVLSLHQDSWIGLAELFSAGPDSEIFTRPDLVDPAYAESWLLAHMLVLDPRYAPKYPDFLAVLQSSDTPEAFRQTYGKSIGQVEQDLKAYLEVGQANVRTLAEPPPFSAQRIEVDREADYEGRLALVEMLRNYLGRAEQSRALYRQLARDYPLRTEPR